MKILKTIEAYRDLKKSLSGKIGFVPTMGALHNGHLSLVDKASQENDHVIVSIFVNPTQFGPNEDYNTYPRTFEADTRLLERKNVTAIFYPSKEIMYPGDEILSFKIDPVFVKKLCGRYRDQHFEGVSGVVLKLFNIIQPDNAYFGLKDYQQYQLIRWVVRDFDLPVNIIGCPVIREKSGLAMSSRNSYLTEAQQKKASAVYQGLLMLSKQIRTLGNCDSEDIFKVYESYLNQEDPAFNIQYIEIYDTNLNPITVYKKDETFLGTAVYYHGVRLIDNIVF